MYLRMRSCSVGDFLPGFCQLSIFFTMAFQSPDLHSPYTGTNQFMATTQRIIQFSEGRDPLPGQRIVYVSGAFDLFRILSQWHWLQPLHSVNANSNVMLFSSLID